MPTKPVRYAAKATAKDKEYWAINALSYAASKLPPTLKHRPAITYGILGTCYGINEAGEVKYFDYDWPAALKFAGVTNAKLELLPDSDLRISKANRPVFLPGHDMWNPERLIRKGQGAWWVLKK